MRIALIALTLVFSACKKPQPAAPDAAVVHAASPAKAVPEGPAQVQFSGQFKTGDVKAARYLIYVSREPCEPIPESVSRFGAMEMPVANMPAFFLEIFVPRNTAAHLCGVGLDKDGRVVGVAGHPKNPLTFAGDGELKFSDFELALKAVEARPSPKGL